jgi:2-C-methyl-D-erythritol 4-phosphate cytidylyltransferase
MKLDTHYWIIIPAAGCGTRFDQQLPKQYYLLGKKTVLEHTVDIFLSRSWVDKIIIALSPEDTYFQQLSMASHPKVKTVWGDQSRSGSVAKAITYIQKIAQPHDWVLTHDAVRPCLHLSDLEALRSHLYEDECGGLLATPVTDTLKYAQTAVAHTVSRENLWHALTPQMFRLGVLAQAIHQVGLSTIVTDEAQMVEQCGYHPKIVAAKHPNPKITYAGDLPYISLLLQKQQQQEELMA